MGAGERTLKKDKKKKKKNMTTIHISSDIYGTTRKMDVFIPTTGHPSLSQVYPLVETALNIEALNCRPQGVEPQPVKVQRFEIYSRGSKSWTPLVDSRQLTEGCSLYAFQQAGEKKFKSPGTKSGYEYRTEVDSPTSPSRDQFTSISITNNHVYGSRRHDSDSDDENRKRHRKKELSYEPTTYVKKERKDDKFWLKYMDGIPGYGNTPVTASRSGSVRRHSDDFDSFYRTERRYVSSPRDLSVSERRRLYDGTAYNPSRQFDSNNSIHDYDNYRDSDRDFQPTGSVRTYDGRLYDPTGERSLNTMNSNRMSTTHSVRRTYDGRPYSPNSQRRSFKSPAVGNSYQSTTPYAMPPPVSMVQSPASGRY